MFEPSAWVSELRSGKCQTWKLSAEGMPFKMTLVGGSSERFFTHKVAGLNISKVNWRHKRHCAFSDGMEVRAGTISFHAPTSLTPKYGQNAANSAGVPILLWMLPITAASEVCNIEGMTQTKPFMFHTWWISRLLVGSDASWAVGCQRNACERIGDAPGGFYLVDFEGSFALGFCDQYRPYDSKFDNQNSQWSFYQFTPLDSVTSLLVVAHSSPGAIECERPFVFLRDAHHRSYVEKASNQRRI